MTQATPAIRAALRDHEPSPEQWAAIRSPLEPVVIAAGAGSGKTAVMTARIVHLVETGQARPAGVLGLTFTNKAAAELEERLAEALGAMVPHPQEHPTVMTYHAFADKLFREQGPRIGVDPDAGLLTNAQKWQLLMGLIDELDEIRDVELRHPLSFIPQTLDLADQCANHLVTPEQLAAECERLLAEDIGDNYVVESLKKRREFARIVGLYQQRKRGRRRIDYGDQIRLAVEVLERHPEVCEQLRERYPVVLLDEYQDTNPAQKVMLRHLCPDGWAVTAVGDARQAIYAWRGASMFNLINFHREFLRADGSPARQASLRENYRSGRKIIELANRIISKVPEEHRPGDEIVAVPQNGEGWVGAAVLPDQESEAVYIAETIEAEHAAGREWRDIAVLVRSRRYLDRIVAALEERDIPFEMPDLGGLLKVPAVVDVVSWLQVLSDPGPQTNRWAARILMGPRFRVHYRDIAPIARRAVERNYELMKELRELLGLEEADPGEVSYSLMEALEEAHTLEGVSEEAQLRIREFLDLVAQLRPMAMRGLQELVQTIVDRTGIAASLQASTSRMAPAMRENLNGFIGVCSEFAPLEGEANLSTFLDFLDVAEESEDAIPLAATASSDSVKIQTIHTAKGLEWDVVFLPYLAASQETSPWDGKKKASVFPNVMLSNPLTSTKQLPPGVRKDSDDLPSFEGCGRNMRKYRDALRTRAEEDERRLFYVAITRAKQRLYCTAAHWYDERKGPSAFLDEVLAAEQADLVLTLDVRAPEPAEDVANPVIEAMRAQLVWPPSPELDVVAAPWVAQVEAFLGGAQPNLSAEAGALYAEHLRTIETLTAAGSSPDSGPERRTSLSATTAVRIASGADSPASILFPLPQRPTEAQRLGIEVHAWIEELHRGLIGLAEEEAFEEASPPPDRETVDRLKASFRELGFEDRTPLELDTGEPATELPFTLRVGGLLVRGRIDAVYDMPDGLEVVDFKTGDTPDEPDWGQLELYAEALLALGLAQEEVTLTYAYLGSARTFSKRYRPGGLDAFEQRLAAVT